VPQPSKFYPLFFGPDLDPSWQVNPGVCTSLTDFVPTKAGTFRSYNCDSLAGTFNAAPSGIFSEATYGIPLYGQVFKRVDGTARMIVGTTTRLMEWDPLNGWRDVSLGAADYTTATKWNFATFGNDIIAVSKATAPQVSNTAGTAFATLGGTPPKASQICVQKTFVMLGDTNNGVDDLGDRWWCSAIGNDASWTASTATQAANGRLLATPGNITGMVPLRDSIVAYKADSMYLMDYVGPGGANAIWSSRLISDQVGCSNGQGVANVQGVHYFVNRGGVWRFDGTSLQNIGAPVNKFVADTIPVASYGTMQAAVDEYYSIIYWYFITGTNTRNSALVYNYLTGQFGFVTHAWATVSTDACRAVVKSSWWDLRAVTSGFGAVSNVLLIGNNVSDSSNTGNLRSVTLGTSTLGSTNASITTGDLGDEKTFTTLLQVKPRGTLLNATMVDGTDKTKDSESSTLDAGTTMTADSTHHRWDIVKSARWHRMTLPFTHGADVAGLTVTYNPSGQE